MEAAVCNVLASGMYLLRMVLMDGQNTPTQTSNTRKLAYTTGWFCNAQWCGTISWKCGKNSFHWQAS